MMDTKPLNIVPSTKMIRKSQKTRKFEVSAIFASDIIFTVLIWQYSNETQITR